ncbi:MAG: hypothetical protein ACI4RR_04770 [Eubacterium sp.]
MKKSLKKVITSFIITGITLAVGFAFTGITFNLFGNLSTQEMKILFAVDVCALIFAGGFFLFVSESKEAKKRSKREFEKRQSRRIAQRAYDLEQINALLNDTNFAA